MDNSHNFKPRRFSTGSIGPGNVVAGYSHTSLDYSIFVLGEGECSGFRVKLRLTGYSEYKDETDGCDIDHLTSLIKKVFERMVENTHQGKPISIEHGEQIQLEKDLLTKLIQELPNLIQYLV